MATKKAGGSSKNGRDSKGRRLGPKKGDGQSVISGNIIIRQRGTKYYPGIKVGMGRDHTIYALEDGVVKYKRSKDNRLYVSVVNSQAIERTYTLPEKKAEISTKKAKAV